MSNENVIKTLTQIFRCFKLPMHFSLKYKNILVTCADNEEQNLHFLSVF